MIYYITELLIPYPPENIHSLLKVFIIVVWMNEYLSMMDNLSISISIGLNQVSSLKIFCHFFNRTFCELC